MINTRHFQIENYISGNESQAAYNQHEEYKGKYNNH